MPVARLEAFQEAVTDLRREVARLTERELAHDVAWSEAKDQVSRHLKRVQSVEARAGVRDSRADLTQQLLDLKLRKAGS